MHSAVLGREVHIGFLTDGQGVHVRPQQKHLSRTFAAHQGDYTGAAAVHRLKAHVRQLFFDKSKSLTDVEVSPRALVQGTAFR